MADPRHRRRQAPAGAMITPGRYAVITWCPKDGTFQGRWSYHSSRADAEAAAPAGEPFTVVDVAVKPSGRRVDVDKLMWW